MGLQMNKTGGFGKRFWAVVVTMGIVLCSITGVVAYELGNNRIETRTQSINEYIKTQSVAYDSFNNAAATKSLVRAAENVSQIALDIDTAGGNTAESFLHKRAKELHMTSVFVLDANGELQNSYSGENLYYADVKSALTDKTALEVASYGDKIYTTRVTLDDGSLTDLACAKRIDQPGIVVAGFYSSKEYLMRYTLSLQTLLTGYSPATNGSIVIEKNNMPVAANVAIENDSRAIQLDPSDVAVVQAIKDNCSENELKLVHSGSSNYLSSYDHVRDYYIYYFTETSPMFVNLFVTIGVIALLYACCVVFFSLRRRKMEHQHLNDMIHQELVYSKQLEKAAANAQRANDSKTEFLRRMSHDIRTPINGIRGMVEVANAYRDDLEKQDECREKIWNASGMLLDLVNESLDMSKLESGEINLDVQPVCLPQLIDDTCQLLERQASDRGVAFIRETPKLEHPMVKTSAVHFKRMLMNIAGNAIKYNKPNGEVRVSYEEISFDGTSSTVRIVISDTGIGMSKEFQEKMFEPFSREQQDCGFRPSGTGLGASIAKNLCECLGGSLEFKSELGLGTTFILTMKFETASGDCPKPEVAHAANKQASLEGVNVLLVEDNELNREIAEFHITQTGAHVVAAVNGCDALETFKNSEVGEFDIILMDIMMPDMNGYEVAQRIRRADRKDAKKVPIIALSANAFSDDIAHAREAGMNGHLSKPIDVRKLIETISAFAHQGDWRL